MESIILRYYAKVPIFRFFKISRIDEKGYENVYVDSHP